MMRPSGLCRWVETEGGLFNYFIRMRLPKTPTINLSMLKKQNWELRSGLLTPPNLVKLLRLVKYWNQHVYKRSLVVL